MRALTCPRCGAPLPATAATSAAIQCEYCHATIATSGGRPTVSRAAVTPAREPVPFASFRAVLTAEALAGREPYDVICELARAHLGRFGESDALARVTIALVRDFQTETGINVERDALVLGRLAEAYMKAVNELSTSPSTELNLPFLAANDQGPRHLARTVTAEIFAQLAERDPAEPARLTATAAPPPAAETEARPEKKKKRFWLF